MIGVLFIGFLSLCLGVLLGVASLITLPVVELTRAIDPEDVEPGKVYYLKGQQSGRSSWRAKEDAWRAGMVDVLRLSETELNQWSRQRLDIELPTSEEEPSEFQATLAYLPTAVNFRIVEDEIQLGTSIELDGYLKDKKVIYQVVGKFEGSSSGVRFVPESGNIGSAPLGSVPLIRNLLFNAVKGRFADGTDLDWLGESLGDVESAEIVEGQLVLRRRAEG